MCCCVEKPVYSRLKVTAGQSVDLLCNTSLTSDIMWTHHHTHDPDVHYVYRNGLIASDKPRLAVKTTGGNFHSLVIDDTELSDSGLYSCYDGDGLRKVGYQLIVNGMCWFVSETYL